MPATYTTSLRFAKPANGDLSWGQTVNDGFTTLADNSIAGKSIITLASTSHTLTNNNGASDEARSMFLEITGAPGGAADIICPAVSKLYIISNTVTGGFAVTLKTAAGTGISVPNGKTMILRCDGTNVVDAITNFSALAVNNDTVVTLAATQTLTNKTFNLANNTLIGTSTQLRSAITDETGTGALVFANTPTLVTPVLGTPTSGTLTNCTGLPISTGVSGLGTGIATFLATPSSANLAAAVTDETGTGALVFANTPALVTPSLGVATATSINKVAITAPATSATLTIANGKTLTANNSLTLAGTDATTMTFPAASTTVAGLGTTQTFTGVNTLSPTARTSGATSYFTLTTPADTGRTASTESIGANFTAATRTWATGALTLQRERVFAAPTYAFAGASTLTTAINVDIAAPIAGTNATITNAYALRSAAAQFTSDVNVTGLTASQAIFTDANKNLVSNAITGTGNVVMSTSPTLTTPNLGTPSAVTLTNGTGLPLTTGVTGTLPVANGGTGITSFGSGVATWLGTPSSANLAAAVTDETGSGALVFATSPTLTTPNLGTPTAITLTNATGLPLTTGVTGTLPVGNGGTGITSLGTGVATWLGTPSSANLAAAVTDETGSGALVFATSPTLTTPNLGTPSAATLTNATGLPLTTGVTGTLPQANGGTGKSSWGNNRIVYTGATGTISESSNFLWTNATSVLSIRSLTISQGGSNVASNVAIGNSGVLGANTTGDNNIAIGSTGVLAANTDGYANYAIGGYALNANTSGYSNIAIGFEALKVNVAGWGNVAIGNSVLDSATGDQNTVIGDASAISVSTGSGNTVVGGGAATTLTTGNNNIVIGFGAATSSATVSDEITLGDYTITSFRVPGLSWTGGVKYINLGVLTVATLPAAATAGAGARAFVSDANATTFASVVAGGGANNIPVYSDGTNWRIG